jgi:hypothetical protein
MRVSYCQRTVTVMKITGAISVRTTDREGVPTGLISLP